MSKTISSSVSATLTLTSGYNPLSITSSGTVSGAPVGIYGSAGTAWYIINQGTVAAQGTNTDGPSAGIQFKQGGTVTNSGYITGYGVGIYVSGTAGTVTNAGMNRLCFSRPVGRRGGPPGGRCCLQYREYCHDLRWR